MIVGHLLQTSHSGLEVEGAHLMAEHDTTV
jgi:hypothetical protein